MSGTRQFFWVKNNVRQNDKDLYTTMSKYLTNKQASKTYYKTMAIDFRNLKKKTIKTRGLNRDYLTDGLRIKYVLEFIGI